MASPGRADRLAAPEPARPISRARQGRPEAPSRPRGAPTTSPRLLRSTRHHGPHCVAPHSYVSWAPRDGSQKRRDSRREPGRHRHPRVRADRRADEVPFAPFVTRGLRSPLTHSPTPPRVPPTATAAPPAGAADVAVEAQWAGPARLPSGPPSGPTLSSGPPHGNTPLPPPSGSTPRRPSRRRPSSTVTARPLRHAPHAPRAIGKRLSGSGGRRPRIKPRLTTANQ